MELKIYMGLEIYMGYETYTGLAKKGKDTKITRNTGMHKI